MTKTYTTIAYMDVSESSGTPKSSILIGFCIINHPFWGTPIFFEKPIWFTYTNRSHTPAPPGLISMDFMKKSGGWFFKQRGTKVVFKKPPCEMEAWLQADGGHLAFDMCYTYQPNKKKPWAPRFCTAEIKQFSNSWENQDRFAVCFIN